MEYHEIADPIHQGPQTKFRFLGRTQRERLEDEERQKRRVLNGLKKYHEHGKPGKATTDMGLMEPD
jgi:hypothetical protein